MVKLCNKCLSPKLTQNPTNSNNGRATSSKYGQTAAIFLNE